MTAQDQLYTYLQPFGSEETVQELVRRISSCSPELMFRPSNTLLCRRLVEQYSYCTPEGKKRCAALLASAMNPKRAEKLHPAFVALPGELSEQDWAILDQMEEQPLPVMNCVLCRVKKSGTGPLARESTVLMRELIPRLTARTPEHGDLIGLQVCYDNLLRLGLADLHMDEECRDPASVQEEAYETIYLMYEDLIAQTYKSACEGMRASGDCQIRVQTGWFSVTAMGRRFVRFCR
ncbi:MAG: Abi-alpha family protein [Butyricicoccus sp.]